MSNTAESIPTVALRGGAHIPQLGFGVFQIPPEATATAVAEALTAGYRHIDTASAYANEAEVSAGIRAAGLDRAEIFITTKCANADHGYERSRHAFKTSLALLEVDYLDLYLIHWPVPAHDLYVDTWRTFTELAEEGLVRAIGVSNFNQPHLERIIRATGVTPAINQVELHPYLQQHGLRREHADLGIVTEAWSPLAQGAVLADPTVVEIAESHGRTTAQVVLRWHLELGNVVIPKSVTPERIEENFNVFDFELTADEHAAIEALDRGQRIGPDPDEFIGPQNVRPPE
jgi:2,5-diketo-D-gluconate reductase A